MRRTLVTALALAALEPLLSVGAAAAATQDVAAAHPSDTCFLHAAALSGDRDAFAKYALVLQLGIGVGKDPQQADYWLSRAQSGTALSPSSGG